MHGLHALAPAALYKYYYTLTCALPPPLPSRQEVIGAIATAKDPQPELLHALASLVHPTKGLPMGSARDKLMLAHADAARVP